MNLCYRPADAIFVPFTQRLTNFPDILPSPNRIRGIGLTQIKNILDGHSHSSNRQVEKIERMSETLATCLHQHDVVHHEVLPTIYPIAATWESVADQSMHLVKWHNHRLRT